MPITTTLILLSYLILCYYLVSFRLVSSCSRLVVLSCLIGSILSHEHLTSHRRTGFHPRPASLMTCCRFCFCQPPQSGLLLVPSSGTTSSRLLGSLSCNCNSNAQDKGWLPVQMFQCCATIKYKMPYTWSPNLRQQPPPPKLEQHMKALRLPR